MAFCRLIFGRNPTAIVAVVRGKHYNNNNNNGIFYGKVYVYVCMVCMALVTTTVLCAISQECVRMVNVVSHS